MVAFSRIEQKGNGILDPILSVFTVSKYPGEHHSRSLDPNHLLQGYNYVGPGSQVKLREKLHDDIPLNDLDKTAKKHDYAYLKEQEDYNIDHDRTKHLNNIWKADDDFVIEAQNSRDDPIMGQIASKLIKTKEQLEKTGILDTKQFSGMGVNDPVHRLRSLVENEYRNEIKKENKVVKHNKQTGGLGPLATIAVPIIASVLSTLTGKIFDTLRSKIEGKGYKMPNLKGKKRNDYIIDLIKQI